MPKLAGSILIVDDNAEALVSARLLLKRHFTQVLTERNPKQIPRHLNESAIDVVLLDMNFSPGSVNGEEGIYWMGRILKTHPQIPVITITAFGYVDMAVKAMKAGATDFVSKPWQNEKLLATVRNTFQHGRSRKALQTLEQQQQLLQADLDTQVGTLIIGDSPAIQQVSAMLRKVAPTLADVLILGENGTGKELVARSLHRISSRKNKVFIKVDLGALTETLFESELFGHVKGAFTDAREDRIGRLEAAQEGTLFLDEIGNLSLPLQAKLLTVLQNRVVSRVGSQQEIPLDFRLVSATNLDLHAAVRDGIFRQDLLYRINTVAIELPPLRERREDIAALAAHFLRQFAQKYQKEGLHLHHAALKKLHRYRWPGNIRELQHALERAVILAESTTLQPHDFLFPSEVRDSESLDSLTDLNLELMERKMVQRALLQHEGNITKAAAALGLTRAALYRRMEKHGL